MFEVFATLCTVPLLTLYAAAALLLDDALAAQLYSLGDHAAFCARILQRLAIMPSLAPSSVQ